MASRKADVTFLRHTLTALANRSVPIAKEAGTRSVGLYEMLRIQEYMDTAISKGASTDVIRQQALESGMVTLLGFSLELVQSPVALYAARAILVSIWLLGIFYASHNGRRTIDRLVLKLPLFGELILMTATAKFCQVISSLTRAGVPILMSMETSSETAGNTFISDAILASRGMVQEGVLMSMR